MPAAAAAAGCHAAFRCRCQALGPGEAAESDALQGILAGNRKSRPIRQCVENVAEPNR